MKKVQFQIDGDPLTYELTFDFNEVCDAEIVAGCNLMGPLAGRGFDAKQTRGLLYAFLRPANPDVLLSEAGGLLTKDMPTVLGAISEVLKDAREEEEEAPATPPAPAAESASPIAAVA